MKFVKIAASSMNSHASSALGIREIFTRVVSKQTPIPQVLALLHPLLQPGHEVAVGFELLEANLNAAPRVIFVASNMKSASARAFGASFSRYALRFPRN